MMQRSIIVAAMIAVAGLAHAADATLPDPPKFKISVSPPFSTSGSVVSYRAGEVTANSPPHRFVTTAAVTQQDGDFGPRAKKQSDSHGWSVKVYAASSEKIAAAYASTKDGYQLRLHEGPGLENPEEGSYLVGRLRRKRFSWGKAVTFLSQFSQDRLMASPHNGRLDYQVWGVTADRKYTVVASISVSHPKLPDEEDDPETLRLFRTIEALKRDRDYKLIERCKPEEFTPSLTAFDEMLDSLTFDERI